MGRRNRRLIAGATAVLLALIAAETVLVIVILTPTAFTWWLLGAFQATVVAAYLHILHAAFRSVHVVEGGSDLLWEDRDPRAPIFV